MAELNLNKCSSDSSAVFIQRNTIQNCLENTISSLSYLKPDTKDKIVRINKSYLPVSIKELPKRTHDKGLYELSFVKQLPQNFSWMEKGGNKIENGSRDQGSCGCCWAFSVTTVLGDRYALTYNIASPEPSVANLVSCGGPWIGSKSYEGNIVQSKDQCICGGITYGGSKYLENNSITKESCWPFSTISNSNIAPNCPNMPDNCCIIDNLNYCCGPNKIPRFSVKKNSTKYVLAKDNFNTPILNQTIEDIKIEILNNGPVSTTIFVPPDFENWWNFHKFNRGNIDNPYLLTEDVFIPKKAPTKDGHAIAITGWGIKNKINYWEIRNSWGSPGYAYVAMSTEYPSNYHFGIDIPIVPPGGSLEENGYQGGVIAFEPGKLSKNIKQNTGTGGKIKKILVEKDNKKNFKYVLIIPIFIMLFIVALLYIFSK